VRRACALAFCWLLGCAGAPFEFTDLPALPIAFSYQTVEQTERVLDEVETRRKAGQRAPEDEFHVELHGLERLAGTLSDRDVALAAQGRVALYVATEQRLELPPALKFARPLDWSPDHGRLMVNVRRHDGLQLVEWVAATGEIRPLTSGPGNRVDGCYGPDGAIAWVEADSEKSDAKTKIWVHFPHEAPRPLTEGPLDLQPVWDPDGSRLVYTRAAVQDALELRWLDPVSGAGGWLGAGRSADFTPDGRWIVYSARTGGGWQIRRMHADGSGKRSFGRSGYVENMPSVSPDGRWVVFAAQAKTGSPMGRLLVRAFDASADRQLEIAGSALHPVW
jgi:hypothetical protein